MQAVHTVWRRVARATVAVVLASSLAACAFITPKRMVPDEAAAAPERTIAQRVRVTPVTGSRKTVFGGPAFPTPEQYQEAIIATLEKSRMFAGVSTTSGDVDLTVTVLSCDQLGFIPLTVRMVANYKFSAPDGSTLWSEIYDSSFSSGDWGGASRTVHANEGAVRENLKAFVLGVRERFQP